MRAGGAPKHEPRGAATPCGESAGRAAWHGLRRRRGRAGKAGRSAAARAGGADGPIAPTSWGPGRAGAPTPQPARGRSEARPAKRPACGLGLAARKGAPEQRRRPTCPGRACPALAATLPRPAPQGMDGAGGGTPPPRAGRGAASRPQGGGWDAPYRRGRGREPPFRRQQAAEPPPSTPAQAGVHVCGGGRRRKPPREARPGQASSAGLRRATASRTACADCQSGRQHTPSPVPGRVGRSPGRRQCGGVSAPPRVGDQGDGVRPGAGGQMADGGQQEPQASV